ncbi:signal peptide, CUB and EGF-like domain-containing protein 1 isoform X2 [Hydra vulgaris]|uniref:signal peptide, CUB and EGF-like domain-containing protein 1 isoform X2 n=1 Tax=Hydra vulgaris TaxID=6087 RepID=UPI001F5F778D|nr:signal peptide, CUB and EGF-like domain-containing protein 1 isoform X2 [Hydra vulgaris]
MAFNGFVKIINILVFGLRQVQLQTYSTSTIYSTTTADMCTLQDCDQICELVSGKAKCHCIIGKLQADNKTCTEDLSGPCSINRGGCDQICKENLGKVECSCIFGKLQPDGKTCKQYYNPCLTKGCDQLCKVSLNKAECSCIYGKLQPNGKTCKEEISNPCLINHGGCHQICKRESDKAVCSCYSGVLQPDGKTCKENFFEDPCIFNGGCEEKCVNILGRAVCSCFAGNLNLDRRTCTKDPCAFNGGCSQKCSVVFGKAVCSCYNGSLNSDGKTCDKGIFHSNGNIWIGVVICCFLVITCYLIYYQRKSKIKRTSAQASSEMQRPSTDVVALHFFETQNSDVEQPATNCHGNLNEDLGVITIVNSNKSPPSYNLVDLHPPPSYESTQFLNLLNVISSDDPPPMYSE